MISFVGQNIGMIKVKSKGKTYEYPDSQHSSIEIRLTQYQRKVFNELKRQTGLSFKKLIELSGSCDCGDPVVFKNKGQEITIPRNILSKKKI